jgi:peptide/nickel transport system substrate-binding protein
MVSDINTLDPCLSSSFYDRQILNNITDKLFDLNSKGKIIPVLATGYKVAPGGFVYTITLRKGVKFQDGTPFNAAAAKFNLDRYRSTACAPRAAELAPVRSVVAKGSSTLVIHLNEPFSPLLSILTDRSGMMMSPKAIQSEGTSFAQKPVGTGPFVFSERVKGDHITLVRNPHYWRKGYPKASEVVFKIFVDPNTELVNLQSGQVDFIDAVTAQNVPTVKNNKKLHLVNRPGYGWGGFWLNVAAPGPLHSKLIREAISAAIDRKAYIKAIAGSTAIPSNSPFGPGEFAYGSWDKPPAQNIKRAKTLVKQSGIKNPSFTFDTTSATVALQGAQILQQMLAKAGITMTIKTEDFPTILDQLSKHNFEASAVGWSGRPDPDQNSYNHFVALGPFNYGQYASGTVTNALNKARATQNLTKRRQYYAIVARTLAKDVPYVFTDHPNNSFAEIAKLKGFNYVPDGIIRTMAMTK